MQTKLTKVPLQGFKLVLYGSRNHAFVEGSGLAILILLAWGEGVRIKEEVWFKGPLVV